MKKYIGVLFFCFALLGNSSSTYGVNSEMVTLYNELKNVEVDPNRTASVENIYIHRDVATFHLEKGTIYFFKPASISGNIHVTGALFIGDGTFSFTPSTEFEWEQVTRFYKKELFENQTFKQKINILFIRFADSTFIELEKKLFFYTASPTKAIKERKSYCERYILEKRNENVIYGILSSLRMNIKDGYFYAHISKENTVPVFFIYNPNNKEEVEFQNRVSELNYLRQTINQFHKQDDYEKVINFDEENKFFVFINHYRIDIQIESNGDFYATATITFEAIRNHVTMINFLIFSKLNINKVLDSDGSALPFIKEEKSSKLIIFLDNPLRKGDSATISVSFQGKILKKEWDCFYCKSSIFWYPRYGWSNRATYDLTFKVPQRYECISVGEKIDEKKEGKYKISRWVQETPIINAYFNLGLFKTYNINVEGVSPITVFMSEKGHRKISEYLIYHRVTFDKNIEEQIGADIANCIKFFTNLFGQYPYEKLYITELPFKYGKSFTGFILFPWYNFKILTDSGYSEIVRAHEVAHQWWGVSVGSKTYHDVWIREGFSQYAGLLYLQWILQDSKRFFEILDEWKEQIFTNRKYLIRNGVEAGPIWLGYRTVTSETEGDYSLIVCKKAAYVLHMLRNIFIDLKTMDEDRFKNMMQDFF
ncbi:MAG: hypothetical protein E3J87_02120, partial [Candidatus Cloacimonadota bacterium]